MLGHQLVLVAIQPHVLLRRGDVHTSDHRTAASLQTVNVNSMTTLISFIGRSESNRAYKVATYRFEDGFEFTTTYFGSAVLNHMRWKRLNGRSTLVPSRWVIIGTPTSGWDQLLDFVAQTDPNSAEAALSWAGKVEKTLQTGPITSDLLREFEQNFAIALGVDVRLYAVANDADAIFEAIRESVAPQSEVVLDITHGYRTMPMHALLALGALRWISGIEITGILYGAFDQPNSDGTKSAQSLENSARLAKLTPALAQLQLMDDVGHIAEIFASSNTELKQRLERTQHFESIMQYGKSSAPRGHALGMLRRFQSTSAIETVCAKAVEEALTRITADGDAFGLRARSQVACKRRDYLRALSLANEALLRLVVDLHGLRSEAELAITNGQRDSLYEVLTQLANNALRDECNKSGAPLNGNKSAYNSLKALKYSRNSVMHPGDGVAGQVAPNVLSDEDEIKALLEWSSKMFDFIKRGRDG